MKIEKTVFNGLFKLNVIPKLFENKASSSTLLNVESYDVWYERHGHVTFGSIKRMVNLTWFLRLEQNHPLDVKYVLRQNIQESLSSIYRTFGPLELIHNDVCDSNMVLLEVVEDIL